MAVEGIEKELSELRGTFESGKTRGIAWRKAQLQAILKLISENEDSIFDALKQDLGKHRVEAYRDEVGVLTKSATHALHNLEKWIAPKKGKLPLLYFPAKAEVMPEPLGVVLIFSSWNFPISLALDPLIGAISAGNTAVVKPSELSPKCSSLLADMVPRYLDSKAIKIIEGGRDVAGQLLQQNWDKIFFTGSQQVGKIVLSAAAKHLTPVTLELGGKSPAIVDRIHAADLKVAVKRIASAKWGACNGQACIGVDYVLVEKEYASVLVESLKKCIHQFYGDNIKNLDNIAAIVNKHHFDRVRNLLKDPRVTASIIYGGSIDEENLIIEPTILLNPPLDSDIMTEEIFGPLLPIITVNKVEESIEFIRARPKPLALYAFTKNEALKKRISLETSSGSLVFNDTMVQFVCDALPFGGVGPSGLGRYHGKYSFDAFSHEKAVLHRTFRLELEPRHPPWNDFKLDFVRLAYRFDYFGLILLLTGLRRLFRSCN
nr:aldehyde dehydrogenase family 3 member F1 [Ipomoea trifida]